jgi:molybdenum-dependent DNA-binding transcriptional regulator ModE
MMASILLCSLLAAATATDTPPPLTSQQIAKLQHLVRRTQGRDAELKAALNDQQQILMKAYSQFELDEKRISKIHKEIIDRQRELLENYRGLQVELREIVGEQRFLHLKKRIDLFLKGKKKTQVRPETSSPGRSTKKIESTSGKSQTP